MNSYSIWVKLDRYPPVLVRLLARSDNRLLSDAELAARSSLPLADIKWLSYLPTWSEVPLGKLKAFCAACNCDFADRERMKVLNRYLKNDPKFAHLKHERNFEQYKEMLNVYLDYETHRN